MGAAAIHSHCDARARGSTAPGSNCVCDPQACPLRRCVPCHCVHTLPYLANEMGEQDGGRRCVRRRTRQPCGPRDVPDAEHRSTPLLMVGAVITTPLALRSARSARSARSKVCMSCIHREWDGWVPWEQAARCRGQEKRLLCRVWETHTRAPALTPGSPSSHAFTKRLLECRTETDGWYMAAATDPSVQNPARTSFRR